MPPCWERPHHSQGRSGRAPLEGVSPWAPPGLSSISRTQFQKNVLNSLQRTDLCSGKVKRNPKYCAHLSALWMVRRIISSALTRLVLGGSFRNRLEAAGRRLSSADKAQPVSAQQCHRNVTPGLAHGAFGNQGSLARTHNARTHVRMHVRTHARAQGRMTHRLGNLPSPLFLFFPPFPASLHPKWCWLSSA